MAFFRQQLAIANGSSYIPKNPNGLSMAGVGPDTETQGSGPSKPYVCGPSARILRV